MHRFVLLCSLLLLGFVNLPSASATPEKSLWSYWSKHKAESTQSIDHSRWSKLLRHSVKVNEGRGNSVNYQLIAEQLKPELYAYLTQLAGTAIINYNRNEQLAYWINLHNALVVKLIVDNYPIQSIRDIGDPDEPRSSPWKRNLIRVNGTSVSLDDIENRIIRPIWPDPRIHYLLANGTVTSGNLLRQAVTADKLEILLNQAARAYINSTKGVTANQQSLQLSALYKRYEQDFGGSKKAILEHVKPFLQDQALLKDTDKTVFMAYDWQLNGS